MKLFKVNAYSECGEFTQTDTYLKVAVNIHDAEKRVLNILKNDYENPKEVFSLETIELNIIDGYEIILK